MDFDFASFEKEDFSFLGCLRAFVENNVDPLEAGRLQVRILGIHSMDPDIAPTISLPWAEPALPLANSGGANLQNANRQSKPSGPDSKYAPSSMIAPLNKELPISPQVDSAVVTKKNTDLHTIPEYRDQALSDSGTGGNYAVPAKGSLVWIFFDGGNHLRPQYFAMATQMRDWIAQKLKLVGEINDRDAIISKALNTLASGKDSVATHQFSGTAMTGKATVTTNLTPPVIPSIGPTFSKSNRMEDITSWTSPGGTTIFSNHTQGNEQLFIIHKGYSQYVDAKGQVTKVVGTTSQDRTSAVTGLTPNNGTGSNIKANDENEFISGLKNIFILGDYNLFPLGNIFIQCNQSAQINANANVGIVARKGNVNVLSEQGAINVESKTGPLSFKAKDIQFEADNSILFKAKNTMDFNSQNSIQMSALNTATMSSPILAFTASNLFSVDATSTINMKSDGVANYISTSTTNLSSETVNINGTEQILLTALTIDAKGTSGLNLQSEGSVNVLGITLNLTGQTETNILGTILSVFGTASATIGGGQATIGGAITNLTGVVNLGAGTVTAPTPATPVEAVFTVPTLSSNSPYKEIAFTISPADITITPTKSQISS